MNVDFRFVLKLNGDGKPLMRDFFASPSSLRKHSEIDAWQIAMVDGGLKADVADTNIEVDRPFFTFTYTYKITNRNTGIILATGKLNAIDSDAAASMLGDRIIDEIRKARGEVKKKK